MRDWLEKALELNLPMGARPPVLGVASSVLALIDGREAPKILLTRRTEIVEKHKGQFAFPGGVCDEDELKARDFIQTALRETKEELGISPPDFEILGSLPSLLTGTGFEIEPVVGVVTSQAPILQFSLSKDEIAEAFWVELKAFLKPGVHTVRLRTFQGVEYPIHYYQIEHRNIWGATAAVIQNLLERLERVGYRLEL